MGYRFADQYSLLHFAAGVILYFWSFTLLNSMILHISFEYVENTKTGMYFINNVFSKGSWRWPGGKPLADKPINSFLGDNIFFASGWIVSYYLDNAGEYFGWYDAHIK